MHHGFMIKIGASKNAN